MYKDITLTPKEAAMTRLALLELLKAYRKYERALPDNNDIKDDIELIKRLIERIKEGK